MVFPLVIRAPVPSDPRTVTTIREGSEVPPSSLGLDPAAVASVWEAVERLYASGIHPAIQLCVRHRGAVLLDRAIGHACGAGPADPPGTPTRPCTPDTPFMLFSAAKSVTAMLVHLLDERNLIRLDDPVCEYIPEFGTHGKQWITIRHLLTHRAGIPNLPPGAMAPETVVDAQRVLELVCEARPVWRPGRELAYHAVSGGFVLGEVIRRVSGRDPREVLDDVLRRPLGCRFMTYGLAPEDLPLLARSYMTGPRQPALVSWLIGRALGITPEEAVDASNDPPFHAALIPSGNLVATAEEMSRFYQLLLEGGELGGVRVFDPRTVRRATSEQSYLEMDFTLVIPIRHAMGFMLGAEWFSLYGPYTPRAFGHIGFTNIVCWADPERQVAAALMTSGKPIIYPEVYWIWEMMRRIGAACPREAGRMLPGAGARAARTPGAAGEG